MPLLMGRPRWCWSGRSARTTRSLVAVAVAVALVVSLCFVGTFASDFRRTAAAAGAAGAHSGDQATTVVEVELLGYGGGRRLLSGGPGSHPPRCTSKCGGCNPCYPVHVSVPPGVLVTTEYYPEAWRCKCRNQLYMP
ncbi:hypothetical protein EJB05_36017 [Eragrostis curvula]|uniref:Epidermal patterning factor-like protein n=1 Tax=Eragrostis curvula TaxID=38414 RepID=A0A5J9U814_9POAL|nr:hypothetical protein EJB05_36017 [Eragrostis curvula]